MQSDYFESLNNMLETYSSFIRCSLMFCKRYNQLSRPIKRTIDTWAHPMYVTSFVKMLSLQRRELQELVEKEVTRENNRGSSKSLEDSRRASVSENREKSSLKKLIDEDSIEKREKQTNLGKQVKMEEQQEMIDEKFENTAKFKRKRLNQNKVHFEQTPIKMQEEEAVKSFQPSIQDLLSRKKQTKSPSPRRILIKPQHQVPPIKQENNQAGPANLIIPKEQIPIFQVKEQDLSQSHVQGLQHEMLPEVLTTRKKKKKSESQQVQGKSKHIRGPYKSYSVEEKMHAVGMFLKQFKSITEISKMLGIPCKNIKRWANEGVFHKRGGGRRKTCPQVEKQTFQWISRTFTESEQIQAGWIQEYALEQSKDPQFKASRGWLLNFLDRYNLRRIYTIT